MSDSHDVASFETAVLTSPLLAPVLEAWREIDLPDAWLVAGAVAQTFWNTAHGFQPAFGIKDIDIVYHDGDDLSEAAEIRNSWRISRAFSALPLRFDVKNEARVHLWYEDKFGYPIDPYESTEAAIATFPTTATAIGVRPSGDGLQVCAPFGLDDLLDLTLRPNKTQITPAIYRAKIARWTALWPKLQVIDWEA